MRRVSFLLALVGPIVLCAMEAPAQNFNWGGSVRGYQFFRLEDVPQALGVDRRDSEFVSGRFTLETEFQPQVRSEAHLVFDFLSPPESTAASVATGRKSTYLPLEHEFTDSEDYRLVGSFDRLNVQLDFRSFRITAGRQAVGWGVTYFWPTMDLFSSFAPQRIDRDYKEGVDAVRVTVPLGLFSEVQVIGAVLGPSFEDDGTAAALGRFHVGRLDLGFMGGRFHGDSVGGAFLTADVKGTAYRAEVTWTDSGDPRDAEIGRRSFWRSTAGIDRQLTPDLGFTLEFSYNGYGANGQDEYRILLESDRVARGEIGGLGKYYAGSAVTWKIHPLWTITQTVLVNWQDPSALWIPALEWSTTTNSTLLLAAQVGLGSELTPELDLESEYGAFPANLFAALKWYF